MAVYNPKSLKAEEFINHEEILETIEYAEKNKHNVELIDSLLEKARPKKNDRGVTCAGLSHREASVLLACDIPEKVEEMYKLANEIKLAFYGNRIVMFAPLYLSNYCVNGCVYCPYHYKNKHIARKKLTQEEVKNEVIALQDMGHKRLAIEAGEDPVNNPIEYIPDELGRVKQVVLQKMELGEPDASGRRSPVAIPGATETLDIDLAIVSVGVSPNPIVPHSIPGLELGRKGTIVVNEEMESSIPMIFAGGDIVRGGATVILAMGDGRRAAAAMHKHLSEPK